MRLAIVGGGIAGCCLAYVFKDYCQAVIFEASDSLFSGASGALGRAVCVPPLKVHGRLASFNLEAFRCAVDFYDPFQAWCDPRGFFIYLDKTQHHHFFSFLDMLRSGTLPFACSLIEEDHDRVVLFLHEGGILDTQILRMHLVTDVEVRLGTSVHEVKLAKDAVLVNDESFDMVIFAHSFGIKKFFPALPMRTNRGVWNFLKKEGIVWKDATLKKKNLFYNVFCFQDDEGYRLGASTVRFADEQQSDFDPYANLKKFPSIWGHLEPECCSGFFSGIRSYFSDYYPFVGSLGHRIFSLTGLGYRGFQWAPFLSKILYEHIVYGKKIEDELNKRAQWGM